MSDLAERLLSDLSKVQVSSNSRSSAKSRAKSENRQQAQVLTNLAKALGSKALSVFTIKVNKIERLMKDAKASNQRVTIKSSYKIEKNSSKANKMLKAHIDYISRDSAGSTPFNETNLSLSKDDLKDFLTGTPEENQKSFRFIISPENAKDFESDVIFKEYIRDCMKQLSRDLPGQPELNYTANIHHDTDNPHCHVLLKGMSKSGQDITIPKEYIKSTFRENSENIATTYLGTRTPQDILDAKLSEITAKRLTTLDFDILRVSTDNVFNTKVFDKATKSQEHRLTTYLIPRLDYLCKIGLATKVKTEYTLSPDYKKTLQDLPLNRDIIKKLADLKKTHFIERIAKYDANDDNAPITGVVVDKAFDEECLLNYAIILDSNKKSHYVTLNKSSETEGNECSIGSHVELTTAAFTPKGGTEFKYPRLTMLSYLSYQQQIDHIGITELDKHIALADYINDNPNIYQKQLIDAVQSRITFLMSKKKLFLIEGKYRFAKTYWQDAENAEHSAIQQSFQKLTYYSLPKDETFKGRIVSSKRFGNETYAIVSNGKRFITIPMRGRMSKLTDKNTMIEISVKYERKGYSAPIYNVKPVLQTLQTIKDTNHQATI